MKFPARTIAILLWILAVALAADQMLQFQKFREMPDAGDTVYVVVHLGNALTLLSALLALGAIVWLLGEIRDRLPERQ